MEIQSDNYLRDESLNNVLSREEYVQIALGELAITNKDYYNKQGYTGNFTEVAKGEWEWITPKKGCTIFLYYAPGRNIRQVNTVKVYIDKNPKKSGNDKHPIRRDNLFRKCDFLHWNFGKFARYLKYVHICSETKAGIECLDIPVEFQRDGIVLYNTQEISKNSYSNKLKDALPLFLLHRLFYDLSESGIDFIREYLTYDLEEEEAKRVINGIFAWARLENNEFAKEAAKYFEGYMARLRLYGNPPTDYPNLFKVMDRIGGVYVPR